MSESILQLKRTMSVDLIRLHASSNGGTNVTSGTSELLKSKENEQEFWYI